MFLRNRRLGNRQNRFGGSNSKAKLFAGDGLDEFDWDQIEPKTRGRDFDDVSDDDEFN